MLTNPYVAGNPVGGSNAFVGRSDVLRSVLRVLKNPGENAIVLYGQRRIGKTSVLQELRQTLPNEGAYYPVYFDLQDKAALPLAKLLSELKERIAQEIKLALPKTKSSDPSTDFREIFLPAVLKHLSAKASLVLLFDEFDVLDNPGEGQAGKDFFPYLRQLLTVDPRLQFVFVIGRRPEDLSSFTLSIFKGVKSERVSLLTAEDCAQLVRLSEANQSLFWSDAAVAQIQAITGGHPFLTQQLCQEIWESAYEADPATPPTIQAKQVDSALAATLQRSTNALEWLWNGLGPAQRIVASALAEAGERPIAQEELESRLQKSGVRILVGELQDAPKLLQDWDIIEPVDTHGALAYRFRVELLRRWIADRKPLRQVQQEIDYVQPAAENLFRAASALYQNGQLAQAVPLLRQAIGLNPNHARGSLLLAEILLAQNEVAEARQLLETLYQIQPAAARPRLVQALLAQAQQMKSWEDALTIYQKVKIIEPSFTIENIEPVEFLSQEKLLSSHLESNMNSDKKFLSGFQDINSSSTDKIKESPYFYGTPARPPYFVGRDESLRKIINHIRKGQSIALVGEPRIGKSSLLQYLRLSDMKDLLHGTELQNWLISFVDASTLSAHIASEYFWQRILEPHEKKFRSPRIKGEIHQAFQQCVQSNYEDGKVSELFENLHRYGFRLVLLLDEFEKLVEISSQNENILRTLCSNIGLTNGGFIVIAGCRKPIDEQALSTSLLSQLKVFIQMRLVGFSDIDIQALLDLSNDRFSLSERAHIERLAGTHPYLLQAICSTLWEASETNWDSHDKKLDSVFQQVFRNNRHFFLDTWQSWSIYTQRAFACVTLLNAKGILDKREFQIKAILDELPKWKPELENLSHQTILLQTKAVAGNWKIRSDMMLAWCVDYIDRAIRDETEFGKWLKDAELDGRLTHGQKEQFRETAKGFRNYTSDLLQKLAIGIGIGMGSGD